MALSHNERSARDAAAERLIGTHGAMLYEPLAKTIYAGKECGQFVKRLADAGRIQLRKRALPGGLTYFQLTPVALAALDLPVERARPLGLAALNDAVGRVEFCLMAEHRRYAIECSETIGFLADQSNKSIDVAKHTPGPNVSHVLSDESGSLVVYRVYQPVPADAATAVKHLRIRIEGAHNNRVLSQYVAARRYGFALLAASPDARSAFERAVDRSGLRDQAEIVVGQGASAETIAEVLKRAKTT